MSPAPRVRFYRNIVGTFVALNIVLLVFVVYLSFVKATITVKAREIPVAKQFIADINAKPTKTTEVPGTVVAKHFEQAKQFQVTGGKQAEGRASGKLYAKNSSGNAVTWIARTRFAASNGQIFRTPVAVSIPARGEKVIDVVADEAGAAGDVPAGPFTMPALPDAAARGITIESREAFTGGVRMIAAVTQQDLDAAKKEVTQEIFKAAQEQLSAESKGNFTGAAYAYELNESRTDTAPGTEAATFTVSVKLKVIGVFYDAKSLLVLAKAKLFESLSDELTLRELDPARVEVQLDKYDLESLIANVKVNANGVAGVKEGGTILNKDRLAGQSVADAVAYLKGFEEVESVDVSLRPFWVKTLPKLKDHIEIVITE